MRARSWHPAGLPGAGWLVIAGTAVVAVAGLHPSVRLADEGDPAVVPSLT